jgi:hypothetical protein
MKDTLNLFLPFCLIFIIIGFSVWKQTVVDKKEGLENMDIDPTDEDVIVRNNYKVKRRKKSAKVTEKMSKRYREGINWDPANLGGKLKKAGKTIKDGVEGAVNKVKDGLTKGFKEMTGFFKNIIKKITDFVKAIKQFFEWLGAGVKCGVQKIKSLRECMIWYLIEIIGKIFYLPFFLLFLFIRAMTDVNIESIIWNVIGIVDTYINSLVGFHVIYFPQYIIEKCYVCRIRNFPDFSNM